MSETDSKELIARMLIESLTSLYTFRSQHPTRNYGREETLLREWRLRPPTNDEHFQGGHEIPLVYHEVDGVQTNRRWAGYRAELTALPLAGEPRPGKIWSLRRLPPPVYEYWLEFERRWVDRVYLPWKVSLPGESKERKVLRACAWHQDDPHRYLELTWDPVTRMDRYVIDDKMSDPVVAKLRGLLALLRGDQRLAAHRPLDTGYYATKDEFHAAVRAAYQYLRQNAAGRTWRPPTQSEVIAYMGIQAATFYRYKGKWPLSWPPS